MKVIFLNIDDVLTVYKDKPSSKDTVPNAIEFSRDAVDSLKEILKESNAKIVFSTRWNYTFSVQTIMAILATHGIYGPYVTPKDLGVKVEDSEGNEKDNDIQISLTEIDPSWHYEVLITPRKMSSMKCNEISWWLDRHKDKIDGYLVLGATKIHWQEYYQVQPERGIGLTKKDVFSALTILNQGMDPYYKRQEEIKKEQEERRIEWENNFKKDNK